MDARHLAELYTIDQERDIAVASQPDSVMLIIHLISPGPWGVAA
jgi:hypothetical protein